jgi:hypothetical protein
MGGLLPYPSLSFHIDKTSNFFSSKSDFLKKIEIIYLFHHLLYYCDISSEIIQNIDYDNFVNFHWWLFNDELFNWLSSVLQLQSSIFIYNTSILMFQSAKALYGNNGFAHAVQGFLLILKPAYQYKQDEIGIHKLDCSLACGH